MDEDGDIYENCAPSYETQIRTAAFNSREEEHNDVSYEDPISSRYVGASSQRAQASCRVKDENITLKNVPTTDSTRKQVSSFTERVMMIGVFLVVVTTLLNTAMCVWLVISFQKPSESAPSSSMKSHLPSTQSPIGDQFGQNQELFSVNRTLAYYHETMLQNVSAAIKSNAEAIANMERNLAEMLNASLLTYAASMPPLSVRLVDGPNRYSGRVEIYYDGDWGTICDDDWDIEDAKVICRMMGYCGASSAHGNARYGEGHGSILLDNVQCSGTEWSIVQCVKAPWRDHNCGHGEDASAVCA